MRRAETRWFGGDDVALDASPTDAVSSQAMAGSSDSGGYPKIKATIGLLAMLAAVTAGAGATMTASLFGALAAFALSAAAALAALFESTHADRHRGWRAGAWAALVPGWVACAALMNAPLGHLDGLRLLISGLIASGVALHVWRWRADQCAAPLGVAGALGIAPLALAAVWSGLGETPVTAISIACALELFGIGGLWLAEALVAFRWPVAPDERADLLAAPANADGLTATLSHRSVRSRQLATAIVLSTSVEGFPCSAN
jgi:hypothetical protein